MKVSTSASVENTTCIIVFTNTFDNCSLWTVSNIFCFDFRIPSRNGIARRINAGRTNVRNKYLDLIGVKPDLLTTSLIVFVL